MKVKYFTPYLKRIMCKYCHGSGLLGISRKQQEQGRDKGVILVDSIDEIIPCHVCVGVGRKINGKK